MKTTQNFQGWATRRNNQPTLDVSGNEMHLTRGGDSDYLINASSMTPSPCQSPLSKFAPRQPSSPKHRPQLLHIVSSTSNRAPNE